MATSRGHKCTDPLQTYYRGELGLDGNFSRVTIWGDDPFVIIAPVVISCSVYMFLTVKWQYARQNTQAKHAGKHASKTRKDKRDTEQ